jgi:hypothetical protein
MQETRRLIITRWNKVDGAIVPVAGHLIGAGNRSVLAMHRRLTRQQQIISDATRYVDATMLPDTRQCRRQIMRAALKAEAALGKKQPRRHISGLSRANRPH